MDALEKRWSRKASGVLYRVPTITGHGVVVGHGTVLVRCRTNELGAAADADRARCLLAIAARRPAPPGIVETLLRALSCWERGERALARIQLAQSCATYVGNVEDARRLFLAEVLLDAGMAPRALAAALELGSPDAEVAKYDPDRPRVPAGSGQTSGQWAKDPTSAFVPTALAVARATGPGLADALGADAIAWLGTIAEGFSLPVALFGAAIIPSPSGRQSADGPVPDRPGLRFHVDYQSGTLRLFSPNDREATDALVAKLGQGGIYRDLASGVPVARAVAGDAVVIDLDRIPKAVTDVPSDDRDGPKLCPAPVPENTKGRMEFDVMYEQYIRDLNNPQRIPQLSPGLTFAYLHQHLLGGLNLMIVVKLTEQ